MLYEWTITKMMEGMMSTTNPLETPAGDAEAPAASAKSSRPVSGVFDDDNNNMQVGSITRQQPVAQPTMLHQQQQPQAISNNTNNNAILTNRMDTSTRRRSETIDLGHDDSLQVEISDAVSEKDKVKFTINTHTMLPEFRKSDFSVIREHEEFIWLQERFVENELYTGYIIPPPPPHPDFESSRRKLQQLGESEGLMTKDEFNKFKQDLEAEYLALFKKTVSMHETFLKRIAQHPVMRKDHNFQVFLEYEQELNVRGKNKRELFASIKRNFTKSADSVIMLNQKDADDYFDHQREFLNEYHTRIRDAGKRSDECFAACKHCLNDMVKIYTCFHDLTVIESSDGMSRFVGRFCDMLERMRKIEFRKAADYDLKLSDTLHYYQREVGAARDLCARRMRALAALDTANKQLERARLRQRSITEVEQAETAQRDGAEKFDRVTQLAKSELADFRLRRVAGFKKNLEELAELEAKHCRAQLHMLETALSDLESIDVLQVVDSGDVDAVRPPIMQQQQQQQNGNNQQNTVMASAPPAVEP